MEEADANHRAFIPLICSVTSQLIAIRRLVVAGLDQPAKQICRCVVEHIDLGVRMTLDADTRQDFLDHPGIADARAFWSRSIKRKQQKGGTHSHLRDRMFTMLHEAGMPETAISEWQQWRSQEETTLQACIHPSLVACQMATHGDAYSDKTDAMHWFAFFGIPCDASNRTLMYATLAMTDYIIFGWIPNYDKDMKKILDNDITSGAFTRVVKGRTVLPKLAAYAIRGVNDGKF